MSKSTAMTVEKIAAFCDNQSIASDVRDRVAKHLLDSIGCAIEGDAET
jgi:2-methylcitrate dehydratase PrpD